MAGELTPMYLLSAASGAPPDRCRIGVTVPVDRAGGRAGVMPAAGSAAVPPADGAVGAR